MISSFVLAGVIASAYYLLFNNVKHIKGSPCAFPLEVLQKEPEGEEVFLEREDGTRLRCIVAGTGSPIVFAHGYGASAKEWNVMTRYLLAAGHRVISFDQRGHGQSTIGQDGIGSLQMAGDYKAILDHFEVTDGILVGHSMGGFLMIVFLLHHPEVVRDRLKGGLIMASFAGDVNKNNAQNKFQIPLIKSGVLSNLVSSDLFGYPFGASLVGDVKDPAMIRVFLDEFLKQNHNKLVPILRALVVESYYDRLHEIDLPTTVVVGTMDKTTPPFHTDDLASGIRAAKLVRVEGKGHMLNWEAPDLLVEEIRKLGAAITRLLSQPN